MKQFKLGDIVTSSQSRDPNTTYEVIEATENWVIVRWTGDEPTNYRIFKDNWNVLSVVSSESIVVTNGEHNCAEHLELAKGFRFDYHYCKLCGSKQHTA